MDGTHVVNHYLIRTLPFLSFTAFPPRPSPLHSLYSGLPSHRLQVGGWAWAPRPNSRWGWEGSPPREIAEEETLRRFRLVSQVSPQVRSPFRGSLCPVSLPFDAGPQRGHVHYAKASSGVIHVCMLPSLGP